MMKANKILGFIYLLALHSTSNLYAAAPAPLDGDIVTMSYNDFVTPIDIDKETVPYSIPDEFVEKYYGPGHGDFDIPSFTTLEGISISVNDLFPEEAPAPLPPPPFSLKAIKRAAIRLSPFYLGRGVHTSPPLIQASRERMVDVHSALLMAVEKNNIEAAQICVDAKKDCGTSSINTRGETAIMIAIREQLPAMLSYLLEKNYKYLSSTLYNPNTNPHFKTVQQFINYARTAGNEDIALMIENKIRISPDEMESRKIKFINDLNNGTLKPDRYRDAKAIKASIFIDSRYYLLELEAALAKIVC